MSNFKTPSQKIFDPVITVFSYGFSGIVLFAVGGLLMMLFLFFLFLIPAVISLAVFYLASYLGSAYAIEIGIATLVCLISVSFLAARFRNTTTVVDRNSRR